MGDELRVTSTAECASCDWTHTVTGASLDDVGQKAERALKEHDSKHHVIPVPSQEANDG